METLYNHTKDHLQAEFEKKAEDYEGKRIVYMDVLEGVVADLVSAADKEKFQNVFASKYFYDDFMEFQQFYDIFQLVNQGHDQVQITQSLKLQRKLRKVLRKFDNLAQSQNSEEQQIQEAGGQNQEVVQKTDIDLKLQIGSTNDNSIIKFNLKKGVGAQELLEKLKFANLDNDNLNLLIRFKTVDSQQAKQTLEELVQQGLMMASEMLPKADFLETIKFEYHTPDQHTLYFKVYSTHLFVSNYLRNLFERLRQSYSGNLDLDLHLQTSFSFQNLHENKDQNMSDLVFNQQDQGLQLEFRVELAKQLVNIIQNILKTKAANKSTRKKREDYFSLNFLLAQLKFDLRFDSFNQISDQIKQALNLNYSVNDIFNGENGEQSPFGSPLSQYINQYYSEACNIPMAKDLIDFVKDQLYADVEIYLVNHPETVNSLQVRLPGLGSFLFGFLQQ